MSIKHFASNWLLNLLLACYKSAETTQTKIQNGARTARNFNPADRLIQGESQLQLTQREKLLAKGHDQLQLAPLLTFCLIQCDALRPNHGSFNPSIDAQCAAAANMYSMSPSVLSRCIAPRIELWMSGKESMQATNNCLNMRMDDIIFAVKDMKHNNESRRPVLFLDSPRQILIHDCHKLCHLYNCGDDNIISETLENAVQAAALSYRVSPPYQGTIEGQFSTISDEAAMCQIKDFLIEDSWLSNGKTYKEWLSLITDQVQTHL